MSNKKQYIKQNNASLLDLQSQIDQFIQSSPGNLLLINFKYFQHKQDRPYGAEPK